MQAPPTSPSRSDQAARAFLIGVLCSVSAFVCFRNASASVLDPDVGWHLRTAEWILQFHSLPCHVPPDADPFSRVNGTSPWPAYSWLFELILLKLYTWMNLRGLVAYAAVMTALITAAVYRMVSRLQGDFTVCALITGAVMVCLWKMSTPRPWLLTILFFALEMDILMQSRRTGKSRGLLWLPLLFAVWANVHIQFIEGLMVLGLAACEPLLASGWKSDTKPAPALHLWLIFAACILATCLNPYGPGIYKIVWKLGSEPGIMNVVSEMMAMPFRTLGDYVLLFLALTASGVLFRFRRLPPFETLLLALAAVISFRSQRDIWFMAITAGAILAAGIPVRAGRRQYRLPGWGLALSAATAVIACALGLALRVDNQKLQASVEDKLPVRAVQVIRERHYTGALFNNFDWGGFLIWNLRQPVSIDGRSAFYGDALINRSRDTWAGAPDWASDPYLQSANLVIAPKGAALTQLLRTDTRFQLAYEDKVAAVFVARGDLRNGENNLASLAAGARGSAR